MSIVARRSLFHRLGGEAAVQMAVDRFYAKVLADERIRHFFNGVDMDSIRFHQKRFLTLAFGGPPNYQGRTLRESHRALVEKMGLKEEHFDALLSQLTATLRELQVPEDLIEEARMIVDAMRDDVMNR